MALTSEEQEAKRQVDKWNRVIKEAQRRRQIVLKGHTHRVEEKSPEDLPRWGFDKENIDWGSAQCCVCNEDFGWYCPDSPDHVCHYYTIGVRQFDHHHKGTARGKVCLIDGLAVDPPDGHEDNESDDWCIYCGDPQERE